WTYPRAQCLPESMARTHVVKQLNRRTAGPFRDLSLYRKLLRQARPYRKHLAGLLLLDLVGSQLVLLTPLPLKIAIDCVLDSHPLPSFMAQVVPTGLAAPTPLLILMAGLLVAVALLNHLQGLASTLLRTYTGEK